jgi:hypothetical protein
VVGLSGLFSPKDLRDGRRARINPRVNGNSTGNALNPQDVHSGSGAYDPMAWISDHDAISLSPRLHREMT